MVGKLKDRSINNREKINSVIKCINVAQAGILHCSNIPKYNSNILSDTFLTLDFKKVVAYNIMQPIIAFRD